MVLLKEINNLIKSLNFNKIYSNAGNSKFYWFNNKCIEVLKYVNE